MPKAGDRGSHLAEQLDAALWEPGEAAASRQQDLARVRQASVVGARMHPWRRRKELGLRRQTRLLGRGKEEDSFLLTLVDDDAIGIDLNRFAHWSPEVLNGRLYEKVLAPLYEHEPIAKRGKPYVP